MKKRKAIEFMPEAQQNNEIVSLEKEELTTKPHMSDTQASGSFAAASSGAGGPLIIIDRLISAVEGIATILGQVAIEKQRTKQVIAMAEAQIEESRQQTNRVKIQQKEETNRMKLQVQVELKALKADLIKYREELKFSEKQMEMSHEEWMEKLHTFRNYANFILMKFDEASGIALEMWKNKEVPHPSLQQQVSEGRNAIIAIIRELNQL